MLVYREVTETTRFPQAIALLLERLSKPISKIDGGCIVCVSAFIEDANKVLVELGLPYHYERLGWGDSKAGWGSALAGDVRLIHENESK